MRGVDKTLQRDDSAVTTEAVTCHAHARVVVGQSTRTFYALSPNGVVVGRTNPDITPDDLPRILVDDPCVSRRHARLHASRAIWQLTDLGGRNRAFVNGSPVPENGDIQLTDGALIRVGDTLLVFRLGTVLPVAECDGNHGRFPGRAPSALAVRRRLHQLSRTTGNVLVLGETGTGKEHVARSLAMQDRPFVPQNCAELTRDLARSELFGHLRGSFSGAITAKTGLVEVAQDGVLFLDEIGELSLEVQAELLRFLEDGYYRPLGATDLRRSTARLVAATNVDLDAAVGAGKFRRDLLARLRASNAPLELPPLRARREDILTWAETFWAEVMPGASAEPAVVWNAGTAECLLLYHWPGNLRELRGLVRGVAAAGLDLTIRHEQLPPELRDHRRALRGVTEQVPVIKEPAALELTRENIEAALSATSGSVRATAIRFGIERRKLYRTCERLGIELDGYRSNPDKDEEPDG